MARQTHRSSRGSGRRIIRAVHLGALLVTLASVPAKAEPPTPSRPRAAKSPKEGSPASEPPRVKLTVESAATTWTWLLRVENTDSVPLRLVGDARLLSLDVNPPLLKPGRPTTIHCTLPVEMRPSTDEESIQIVPPGLSYVETFDPRLYCFDAQSARALTPGATVVARFGFAATRRQSPSPPFVVAPMEDEPGRGSAKEIVSAPFALPESLPAVDSDHGESLGTPDAPPARLAVSTPIRIDAATLADLTLPITVSNPTSRSVAFLLRPETVAIDATGPSGKRRCQWLIIPSPIAELFTALPPKGRASTEVLVSSLCPRTLFDRAGLYVLRAAVDTRRASGASIGIHTFDGEAWSPSATLVRLRTGNHNGSQVE